MEARETLATSIVKGAENASVELTADCVATVMTVLAVSPKGAQRHQSKTRLVMLPSGKNADKHILGYSLPLGTFKALMKLNTLADAVGHLYSDRNLVVAPLVASILALSTSRLVTDSWSVDVILSLVSECME
jgi:hypothetical protein